MGIIKRQGLKGTFVSYIGLGIGYLNLILLYPLCLKPEQIGLITQLQHTGVLFAVICQLGMVNVAVRYFPHFKNEEKAHHGLLFWVILVPTLGFLLFVALYLGFPNLFLNYFREQAPLLVEQAIWLIPVAGFMMYSTLLEHWASLYHRITVPRIIRELVLKLLASACIGLYFFGWISFPLFLGLFALSYGANVILLVIYLVQIGAWKWSIDLSFPTSALVKNMAWYSVFIIIGGLGSGIVTKIDGIMITAEIGLAAAATYNIALSMATVIEIPMRALQQISMPIVSQLISEKKFSDLEILYRKASITQLAAGVLLFGGIWINTDLLFRLMPNGELYAGGKMVIFWIGMSKLLDMTTSLNSVIVNHSPYYRFSLVTMLLLAGMAILTNLWLIPILGVEGAALAALLSLGVYNVLMVGFVWLKYKIQPITTGIPKVLIFGAIALGANSLLPELEIWILELILRSLVFTILFGSLVLIFKISPDINQAIFSIPSWINERIHGVRLRDTEK